MSRASRPLRCSLLSATALLTTLALCLPRPASAQEEDEDPPGRVARLSGLRGAVSFQPAGESDWAEATPNRPLTTADRLWTEPGARAELGVGPVTVRLGSSTDFTLLNLDDRIVQRRSPSSRRAPTASRRARTAARRWSGASQAKARPLAAARATRSGAPALVAFIGGRGYSVSGSGGGSDGEVGWFPLGRREVEAVRPPPAAAARPMSGMAPPTRPGTARTLPPGSLPSPGADPRAQEPTPHRPGGQPSGPALPVEHNEPSVTRLSDGAPPPSPRPPDRPPVARPPERVHPAPPGPDRAPPDHTRSPDRGPGAPRPPDRAAPPAQDPPVEKQPPRTPGPRTLHPSDRE